MDRRSCNGALDFGRLASFYGDLNNRVSTYLDADTVACVGRGASLAVDAINCLSVAFNFTRGVVSEGLNWAYKVDGVCGNVNVGANYGVSVKARSCLVGPIKIGD